MSDVLDLQSSAARLCSCLSATIKNEEAFDCSSSSITHLALYALFFSSLAPLHPGRLQYNWGGGRSGCVLNLCVFPSPPPPAFSPLSCCKKMNHCKLLFTLHARRVFLNVCLKVSLLLVRCCIYSTVLHQLLSCNPLCSSELKTWKMWDKKGALFWEIFQYNIALVMIADLEEKVILPCLNVG